VVIDVTDSLRDGFSLLLWTQSPKHQRKPFSNSKLLRPQLMAKTKSRKRADALLKRDGDGCWLCDEKIDFDAVPNSDYAWSVEHLLASKYHGPDDLENLVLCHPICNRELSDLTLREKINKREQRLREQWVESLVARAVQALAA
jgi:5-methylcytosine-specific restriction endonuclease McrA